MQRSEPHRWEPGCGCSHCALVDTMILIEARASVAISHDPRCQTISLDELEAGAVRDS